MERGGRQRVPLARTNCLKFSFVPSAVSMFNEVLSVHKMTGVCVCVRVCVCVCIYVVYPDVCL